MSKIHSRSSNVNNIKTTLKSLDPTENCPTEEAPEQRKRTNGRYFGTATARIRCNVTTAFVL